MKICIAASAAQKIALQEKTVNKNVTIVWLDDTTTLLQQDADFFIDCTFSGTEIPKTDIPVLLHSPIYTLAEMQASSQVARFCAWDGFLNRTTWEIAAGDGQTEWLNEMMNTIGWKFLYVADEPGLVSPRIICSIINEAFYTLQQGVSSPAEIDLAMKLGTNYSYGPFEWTQKIGKENVEELLMQLSKINNLYQPAINLSY